MRRTRLAHRHRSDDGASDASAIERGGLHQTCATTNSCSDACSGLEEATGERHDPLSKCLKILALPRGDEEQLRKALKNKYKSALLLRNCYHEMLPHPTIGSR